MTTTTTKKTFDLQGIFSSYADAIEWASVVNIPTGTTHIRFTIERNGRRREWTIDADDKGLA